MKKAVLIGGDGIGPEVISSAKQVLEDLHLDLELIPAEMGSLCFKRSGSYLPPETIEAIEDSDAALFGAISTPLSDPSYRSPILRLRKEMDLYANVRPIKRLHPSVGLVNLDIVIVRENTEGMYSGVEREEEDAVITERRVSRKACERIVDFAADLCLRDGRKRLTCVHKANVLRKSDGLFRTVFAERVRGKNFHSDEMLVDAAAAAMITHPHRLDCLVTLNLYGDILTDEAAALVGGMGFAPSGNIGKRFGLFEPAHGSAPDIAGKGIANPIAAILAAKLMVDQLGRPDMGRLIEFAVRRAMAEKQVTPDLGGKLTTREVGDYIAGIVKSSG